MFDCPSCALDAGTKDGKKVLKWELHACPEQCLGFSKDNSALVALVGNIKTERFSPQFHVVFNEPFETVMSVMETDFEENGSICSKTHATCVLIGLNLKKATNSFPSGFKKLQRICHKRRLSSCQNRQSFPITTNGRIH